MSPGEAKRVLSIAVRAKDELSKPLRAVRAAITALQKTATVAFKGIRSVIGLAGKAIRALLSPVTLLSAAFSAITFGAVINEAAEAQRVMAKFTTVFADQSEAVEQWADDFALAVGRARIDVKQQLGTLQDTFVPLGFAREESAELSQAITMLGTDLASWETTVRSAEEAVDLLVSAIVGNHRAVRRFGVQITEATLEEEAFALGLNLGTHELSERQKSLLRLGIILRSTADAHGAAALQLHNFTNSWGALRGAIKDVSISLGEPFLAPLARAARGLRSFLLENEDRIAAFAERVVLEAVTLAFRVRTAMKIMREAMADTEQAEAARQALTALGEFVLTVFRETLIAGGRVIANVLTAAARPLLSVMKVLGVELGQALFDGIMNPFVDSPAERLASAIEGEGKLRETIESTNRALADAMRQRQELARAGRAVPEELQQFIAGTSAALVGMEQQHAAAVREVAAAQRGLNDEVGVTERVINRLADDLPGALDGARQDFDDITDAASDFNRETEAAWASVVAQLEAIGQHNPALASLIDELIRAREEAQAWLDSTDAGTEAAETAATMQERYRSIMEKITALLPLYAQGTQDAAQETERLLRAERELVDLMQSVDRDIRHGRADLLGGNAGAIAAAENEFIDRQLKLDRRREERMATIDAMLRDQLITHQQHHDQLARIERAYAIQSEVIWRDRNARLHEINGSFTDGMIAAARDLMDQVGAAFEEGRAFMEATIRAVQDGFGHAFADILTGTRTVREGFREMARDVLQIVGQLIARLAAVRIASAFFPGANLGGLIGSAQGNVIEAGRVVPFARGGIVDQPTIFPLRSGAGLMGEAGPEAILPLRRTGRGELGVVAADAGGPVNITFNVVANDTRGFDHLLQQREGQIRGMIERAMRERRSFRQTMTGGRV